MSGDQIIMELVNRVVDENAKSFKDLYVKPISIGHLAQDLVREVFTLYNQNFASKRDEYTR